jgi:NADH-quinone oxidoreductase subunit E
LFSPELRAQAEELIGRYPAPRSALLPLLHLVQAQDGYVTDEGLAECAEMLALTKAEVGAVATFYTMYKREEMGRHLVSVCTNFSCKVRGALDVYGRLSDKLGVGQNGTNREAGITLEHAECLGNCEGAPVLTVDYYNYECVTPDAAEKIVDACIEGSPPAPTRGEPPTGIRDAEYRLAGLGGKGDGRTGAALARARATDGGLVPARTAESGPGFTTVSVEPTFSEGQAERREAAKQAVREAGRDPDQVQEEAGAKAREFPTRDPDWEPTEPGTPPESDTQGAGEGEDPRGDDQTPEARSDEAGTEAQSDDADRTDAGDDDKENADG